MHPHIAILTTARIGSSSRMHGNGIQRTKMTPYSSDLILEDLVVESRLEFTLSCTRGGDIHGCLSTAQNHKVFPGCYGCSIERGVGYVVFENFEGSSADDFGGLIFAGGYEVGSVGAELDVVDGGVVLVDFVVVDEFTGLARVSIRVDVWEAWVSRHYAYL